ncbi:hypothetical protein Q3V94_13620 [Caloramator sp. CAR-1]|uniref:hypothetical protein n=1 Tax=Caloramator sp. CAR-1 TaxID=3062777 RepID=UPI0026E2680E|nr:hypothetical protein [Caloramator sp. CAR-1]MDO6355130.1 hypothetical protein [Caloramator sp. CAR-1]MDO6356089.1 hypothetical protein [Caloramator sp. CAR-1]
MIIKGDNLKLYYRDNRGLGISINMTEIEKEEYGYDLTPGQFIYSLIYDNNELYYRCVIKDVSEEGITIEKALLLNEERFLPWTKEVNGNLLILKCRPCEILFEKMKLKEAIARYEDKIWYEHGGWRKTSEFAKNLKNFVQLGQLKLI